MKNTTKFKLVLVLLSFTLFKSIEAQTSRTISTNFQSIRSFIIHIPSGYDPSKPIPMVLVFHGGGNPAIGNALDMANRTGFHLIGETDTFITIYPQSKFPGEWADSRGNTADINLIKDVDFTFHIIDTVKTLYTIDSTRIYAAGLSTGGFLCQRIALTPNHKIAAFASVAASLTTSLMPTPYFHPEKKTPILYMNGTADNRQPYYGGKHLQPSGIGDFINTESAVTSWKLINNCPQSPTVFHYPDINTSDKSTVTKFTYYPCQNCTEVILYRINNGGHTWPGGNNPSALGTVNLDINPSKEIWSFFKRHKLVYPGTQFPLNTDQDLLPDFCDSCPQDVNNDVDGDGQCGGDDNCPTDANADQDDIDADGKGDRCDQLVNFSGAGTKLKDIITNHSPGLNNNLKNTFLSKISSSMTSCLSLNKAGAISDLNSFINKVNAVRGSKGVSNAKANQLIEYAQDLIDAIEKGKTDCK